MTLLQETSTPTICEKNRYVVELNSKFNVGTRYSPCKPQVHNLPICARLANCNNFGHSLRKGKSAPVRFQW